MHVPRTYMTTTLVFLSLVSVCAGDDATVETACFMGEPKSQVFEVDDVLTNEGFVLGFSRETRTPLWVCYKFDNSGDTHSLTRPKNKTFNQFRDGDFVLRHKDYSHSGYDRGHMAPSSGIGKYYGKDAQLGTFKTTNICPQHPGLNQRCWERFEKQVADFYAERLDEIWVVTGPIFGEQCLELESDIRVPAAFYKIVIAKIENNIEMLGIVMPNERTENTEIFRFIQTVDDIEATTGIDFFHKLEDSQEDAAEAKGTFDNRVHDAWSVGWELRPLFDGRERSFRVRECD